MLFFGFGLADGMLFLLDQTTYDKNKFPRAPIHLTVSHPTALLRNSILCIPAPHRNYKTFGHSYRTNGLGFLGKNFSFNRDKHVFRILVLGDSLTFGIGVNFDQGYTNLLLEMLKLGKSVKLKNIDNRCYKQSPRQKIKYEVINFGIDGYSADQERDLLDALSKYIQYDLIVIGVCWNDLRMTTRKRLRETSLLAEQGGEIFRHNLRKGDDEIFSNPQRRY